MNSTKANEIFQFQEQHSVECSNHSDKISLKEKSIIGTFQSETSCLPYGRNFLEASAGNVYENSKEASSFGGSFGHANTDSIFWGGKFGTHGSDDTQVVPDFDDLLEKIRADIDRTGVSRESLVAETECRSSRAHFDSSGRPKRRKSERDELEIYFPCVLTPLPVDRLYSTLADDATVFKFPVSSIEHFANDKSKQYLSSEHDLNADEIRHSLDSFDNVSVLSFSEGSEKKFVKSDVTSTDARISTGGNEHDFIEEQQQFLDTGQTCISEQQILPLSTMTIGNKLKFQNSITSGSCPEAIHVCISSLDQNTQSSRKQCGSPWQRSQTIHDPLVQSSNTSTSAEYLELSQSVKVNTDPSLNVFPMNNWRNCVNFDIPVKNPSFTKDGFVEGGEAPVECSRLGFLAPPPICPRIDNASMNLCDHKAGQEEESSLCGNFAVIKTGTNYEDSDETVSIKFASKRSKNRNAKPIGNERGTSYSCSSRGFHNNLEKQRRINMKARFQNLRMALPELSDNQRASKIAILRKALECIGMLEKESVKLEYIKRTEKLKNIELLNKLQNITSGQC